MNNLIQSLPSPSAYSEGFTHTWMGEAWTVDGEASVAMMAIISSNSPSRQGARTEFLIPKVEFSAAAEFWMSSGRLFEPPCVFRSRALSSPEESVGGWPRRRHHRAARPRGPPRRHVVGAPRGPPPSRLLAP